MSKITNALAFLNEVRTLNAKPAVSSWKKSMSLLLDAIQKEEAQASGENVLRRNEDLSINANEGAIAIVAKKAGVSEDAVANTVARLAQEARDANEKIARKRMTSGNAPVKPIDTDALSDRAKATRKPATQKIAAAVAAAKTRVKQTKTITPKAKQDREGAVVNVAAIAKELGINAKVARATIRRKKIDRTDATAIRAALAKK